MISFEQAKKFVSDLNAEELKDFVKGRIFGAGPSVSQSPLADEASEDVVIALLRSNELDKDARDSVIHALQDSYADMLAVLARSGSVEDEQYRDVIGRLCRVVDATTPEELSGHARSFLNLALTKDSNRDDILGPAARACMSYRDQSFMSDWRNIIEHYPRMAAYAFNAMLKIKMRREEAMGYLQMLWERQVENGWPVDAAFLLRRAARDYGDDIVDELLEHLKEKRFWAGAREELERRAWSVRWLEQNAQRAWGMRVSGDYEREEPRLRGGRTAECRHGIIDGSSYGFVVNFPLYDFTEHREFKGIISSFFKRKGYIAGSSHSHEYDEVNRYADA